MTPPSSGEFVGREHRLPVRIYYEDTDFTGVVYHANYLRYLERGRSDFLRLAGVSHSELLDHAEPTAFVVTRMEIDWRAPARIDDALLVRTTYDVARGPRLSISQTITRAEQMLVEAKIFTACVRPGGGARKPPPGLHDILRPYLLPGG